MRREHLGASSTRETFVHDSRRFTSGYHHTPLCGLIQIIKNYL
ncbi:MAG: hypothetical protein WKF71_17905 [Pyrinomonadaceae bacterium]